jgi:Late competence development protein ComFB
MSTPAADFSSIHNHQERLVMQTIALRAREFPSVNAEQLPDVACVALNRLPARYIRHGAQHLAAYETEAEREQARQAADEAVRYALGFIQAREAMRVKG